MKYLILKDNHYSTVKFHGFHFGKKKMVKTVIFTESCRYDLESKDQLDVNKLFGFSQLYHQHNSIRVGWRYSLEHKQIELLSYVYIDGERTFESLGFYDIGAAIHIKLRIKQGLYWFIVDGETRAKYVYQYSFNWGYNLGPFFGGNQVAPHNIEINFS